MNQPKSRAQWWNSLIVRVIGLCVILFLCLLGSVYAITRFYFQQIALERTQAIAQGFQLYVDEHTGDEGFEEFKSRVMQEQTDITQLMIESNATHEVPRVEQLVDEKGNVVIVASTVIRSGETPTRLTIHFAPRLQAEILNAFRDRFLVAVTAVFVCALGLLIYLIYKALRPLQELSETCAQVSEGNLNEVEVKQNYGEVLALEQTFNRMVRSLREKELVETNLRQAQRLSALGTLAAGVAHDIRNPLNAIKLLSSHALSSLEKGNGNAQSAARQVQTIRSEVDRLEDIVSGFLSLAKEHELQPEPARVDEILRECVHLVEKDAEARDVRLVVELRAGDKTLMLDPKHWTRAILNVMINALEACPPGGRVRLFSRLTDSHCEIEVRDDGPGMPKDVAEKVFDPYFTTKPTGTGLGLSITRGIVEEHGGNISITSVEGQGCQVLITLPLEQRTV